MKAKLKKIDSHYFLIVDDKTFGSTMEPHLSASIRHALSLKNCQAIERGYDLDELAEEHIGCSEESYTLTDHWRYKSFQAGFQKAVEILGDKKFTEEDMGVMMEETILWLAGKTGIGSGEFFDKTIQSLQQNEWEVEIEMEDVIGNLHETHHTNPTLSFPKQPIAYGEKPKLDADGCLILKRV